MMDITLLSNDFFIVLKELINTPSRFDSIGDKSVCGGRLLKFNTTGTDPDRNDPNHCKKCEFLFFLLSKL